jgi:hypothetical protein
LIASTFAALFILPLAFAWGQEKSTTQSVSLDPEDPESRNFIQLSPNTLLTHRDY